MKKCIKMTYIYRKRPFIYMNWFLHSFTPKNKLPFGLWKLTKDDLILSIVCIAIHMIIHCTSLYFNVENKSILGFRDCPQYLLTAKYLITTPESDPVQSILRIPYTKIYSQTPIYPIILKLLSIMCLNNYILGQIVSIYLANLFFIYIFRRFLITLHLVQDPFFTTFLVMLIPFRFTLYSSTPSSYPIYLSFILLGFIHFSVDNFIQVAVFVICAALSRPEGFINYFIFLVLYLVRSLTKFSHIWKILTIIVPFSVHLVFLNNHVGSLKEYFIWAIFIPYMKNDEIFGKPLTEFFSLLDTISNLRKIHGYIDFYLPMILSIAALFAKSPALAFFSLFYFSIIIFINNDAVFMLAIPIQIFGFLIGFDIIFTKPSSRKVIYVFSVFILIWDTVFSMKEFPKRNPFQQIWLELVKN